jgi:glutaredoxin/glutathione-dependent peroxiredoxin
MIQIGQRLPAATLREFVPDADTCALGPQALQVPQALAGRSIVVVGVPGAFTPACSERHLPGFVDLAPQFMARGVDELWCVATNDAFVMGAWGVHTGAAAAVRMLSDGNAEFTRALGLLLDLSAKGLGLRSQRYSMWVLDGVVKALHVDATGALQTSDAATLLADLPAGEALASAAAEAVQP